LIGIDTRGSTRFVGVVGLIALLFATIAPALLTIRTAEAAVPTAVTVFAGTVPSGFIGAGGVPNSATGGTFRVAADVDDNDGVDAGQTNETNVQMSTSRGTFTDSGSASVIIPCAIDGVARAAAAPFVEDIDGGGPAPALTFTDPTYLAGIAVENEPEADGGAATTDGTATDALDEGCLAVDAFVQFSSSTNGLTAISATAQNGGAAGSTVVTIGTFSGSVATLTLTNTEGAQYIAPNLTGRFVSPNDEVTMTASNRDAGGNPVAGVVNIWTIDQGGIDLTASGTCGSTPNNSSELTDVNGNSTVDICARPGNALGTRTVTVQEPTSGRTATATVTYVGPPARVDMRTEIIASTGGTSALESSQAAVGPAVSIRAIVECRDADNRPCADGTGLALAASGAGTVVSAVTTFTAGRATGIVTTNSEQNASVAITASVATADGNVVSDAETVNLRAAQPTATGTATGTATATATAAPGCTVTPNSPYSSGLNAVVVQGTCTSASAASVIATASGRTVLSIFVLAGGNWLYFLPAFPAINGGLTNFPGPLASAIVAIQ
jgi:hypothetical protein